MLYKKLRQIMLFLDFEWRVMYVTSYFMTYKFVSLLGKGEPFKFSKDEFIFVQNFLCRWSLCSRYNQCFQSFSFSLDFSWIKNNDYFNGSNLVETQTWFIPGWFWCHAGYRNQNCSMRAHRAPPPPPGEIGLKVRSMTLLKVDKSEGSFK